MRVTIQELAEVLGVSERTAYRYIRRGVVARNPDGGIDVARAVRAMAELKARITTAGLIEKPIPAELGRARRAARDLLAFVDKLEGTDQ